MKYPDILLKNVGFIIKQEAISEEDCDEQQIGEVGAVKFCWETDAGDIPLAPTGPQPGLYKVSETDKFCITRNFVLKTRNVFVFENDEFCRAVLTS